MRWQEEVCDTAFDVHHVTTLGALHLAVDDGGLDEQRVQLAQQRQVECLGPLWRELSVAQVGHDGAERRPLDPVEKRLEKIEVGLLDGGGLELTVDKAEGKVSARLHRTLHKVGGENLHCRSQSEKG